MISTMLRCLLIAPIVLCFMVNCSETYDIVISGGTVIDGTGSEEFTADVGIRDGVITKIGKIGSNNEIGALIDAKGKYVVPGFIDIHTHSDNVRNEELKSAQNYLTQGVTTMVTGNCGSGTYNAADFFTRIEEQGIGTNIVHLAGHGTIRRAVLGNENRKPTDEELDKMRGLIRQAMQDGAAGLSSGLFYSPGSYAEAEEVIELCKVVKEFGGFYASHIRDESNYTTGLRASIEEAIEIGEKSGVGVQISHIKALGKPVWGMAEEICGIIEAAQDRGVYVLADQYPYNASSTSLAAAVVPRWVQAGGKQREHLTDKSQLPRIKKEMLENIDRRGGGESLVIAAYSPNKEWEGKNLAEIAGIMKKSEVDAAIELVLQGRPGIISFNMTDSDVEYFMKKPYVMTSSDGSSMLFGRAKPHPRNYGTFPKKIRTYVFEKNTIPLVQAIRSATGLPAEMLGFKNRGLLKKGFAADITVFDPETIRDKAEFTDPHQYSEGINWVLVNGRIVIADGEYNGKLFGKVLRRNAQKQ